MGAIDAAEIDLRFDYHEPTIGRSIDHAHAREAVKDLALNLAQGLPESREKSLAITALEECLFWTNAAIARAAA